MLCNVWQSNDRKFMNKQNNYKHSLAVWKIMNTHVWPAVSLILRILMQLTFRYSLLQLHLYNCASINMSVKWIFLISRNIFQLVPWQVKLLYKLRVLLWQYVHPLRWKLDHVHALVLIDRHAHTHTLTHTHLHTLTLTYMTEPDSVNMDTWHLYNLHT